VRLAYTLISLVETPILASPGTLIKNALCRYRDAWRVICGLTGLYAGATVGLVVVVGAVVLGGLLALKGNVPAIVLGGMVLILIAVLALFSFAALFNFAFASIAVAPEPLTLREAFDRGWQGAVSYFWLTVVQMTLVAGGYVLLVVPGVIFFVLSSVSVFALVAEQQHGVAAIARSWSYVSRRKWDVFWRLVVFTVLLVLAFFATRVAVLIIARFVGPVTAFAISEAVSLLFDFLVLPLVILFLGELYKSLRTSRPLTPEAVALEGDHRGVIIGFSLFGGLIVAAYLGLFLLGALLFVAAPPAPPTSMPSFFVK